MGETTKAYLRTIACIKEARYTVMGRKARMNVCAEHRFRADFALLIEKGLLIEEMGKLTGKCEAPVFKITGTV